MLAAVLVMYVVLGVLYESFVHPLTILSTLPSAGLGALLAMTITGADLDVIGIIGIILLIGIVKKNAIMMIDFAHRRRARRGPDAARGHPPGLPAALPADPDDDDGRADLGRCRWRSARGNGSELRQPLGVAMIGGLARQPIADAVHDAGRSISPSIDWPCDCGSRFGARRRGEPLVNMARPSSAARSRRRC